MEIAGIIIALFIIAFLREWFRVPRIEAWCRLHGLELETGGQPPFKIQLIKKKGHP